MLQLSSDSSGSSSEIPTASSSLILEPRPDILAVGDKSSIFTLFVGGEERELIEKLVLVLVNSRQIN